MPSRLTISPDRLSRMTGAPWAMRKDAMQSLALQIIAAVEFEGPPKLEAELIEEPPAVEEAKVPRLPKVKGGVAIVPVNGTIAQHRGSDYWGGVYTEELTAMVAHLVDTPNVGAIVLSFDSPGGIVYGVPEAAEAIRAMGQAKPIYGYVKAEAASAAYWLAANTSKLFAQPSSKVGSIGVWLMHVDQSKMLEEWGFAVTMISAGKFKTEGHPFGPLEEEAAAEFQGSVDRYYEDFLGGVAVGRGVAKAAVKSDFGEGRMMDATRAKAAGMIDGITTLNELVAGLMAPPRAKRASMAARIALERAKNPLEVQPLNRVC